METHLMAHMRQVGSFGPYQMYEIERFLQVEMRLMRLFAQRVDDKYLEVSQLFDFGAGDGLDIGQVGKIVDAVTESLQFSVHDLDGNNDFSGGIERLVIRDFERFDGRCARIPVDGLKNIVEALFQVADDAAVGIYRDVALFEIERADVVDTGGMVGMLVGKKDRIDARTLRSEHLLAEIRPAIDDERIAFTVYPYRNTQPFVFRVGAFANRVLASDDRNALRSSRTQKIDLQVCYFFTKIG